MNLDVICFYADLGRPYLPLLQRMTESAKAAMVCRTILMTPTPSAQLARSFDHIIPTIYPVTAGNLCLERARSMVTIMLRTRNHTIFVDPDIEFIGTPPLGHSFDVGLLWRQKADQPVNTGVILARPGCHEFWSHYGKICANLPSSVHGWYCDQLAFALLTGVCHAPGDTVLVDDATVKLLPAYDHCYRPGKITANAWGVHYKGIDKGDAFAGRYEKPDMPGIAYGARI